MRHQVFAIFAAAGLAFPAFAQDIPGSTDLPNSNPPAEASAGNNGPGDLFGTLAEIKEVKEQIDNAIAEANDEFKGLLEQDNLSFGDMRRLAELRQELGEEVAPELVAQISEIKETVAEHASAGGHMCIARPELTDEQQSAIQEHKDALGAKRDELNAILIAADDSGRYEELLNDEEKTAEERQELRELRRTLIEGSEDATAKVQEIREFNSEFRQDFRQTFDRPVFSRPNIRPSKQAMAKLNNKVNDILAQSNAEYADLLAKEDKSTDDLARLADLKSELLQNADEDVAAQLQETKATFARIAQQRRNRSRRILGDPNVELGNGQNLGGTNGNAGGGNAAKYDEGADILGNNDPAVGTLVFGGGAMTVDGGAPGTNGGVAGEAGGEDKPSRPSRPGIRGDNDATGSGEL